MIDAARDWLPASGMSSRHWLGRTPSVLVTVAMTPQRARGGGRAAARSPARLRAWRSVGGGSSSLREKGGAVSGETWPRRLPRGSGAPRCLSPPLLRHGLPSPVPAATPVLPQPAGGPGELLRRRGCRQPVCAGAGCGGFLALSGAQPPEAAGQGGRCYGNRAGRREGVRPGHGLRRRRRGRLGCGDASASAAGSLPALGRSRGEPGSGGRPGPALSGALVLGGVRPRRGGCQGGPRSGGAGCPRVSGAARCQGTPLACCSPARSSRAPRAGECLPALPSLSLRRPRCALPPPNVISALLRRQFTCWSQLPRSILCCFSSAFL